MSKMSSSIYEYGDVILGSVFTNLNFISIMLYMQDKNILWLILAFTSAFAVVLIFIRLFSHKDVISSFLIVKLAAIIFSVPIGVFLFKKSVKFRHILGVALALTAVYLLR